MLNLTNLTSGDVIYQCCRWFSFFVALIQMLFIASTSCRLYHSNDFTRNQEDDVVEQGPHRTVLELYDMGPINSNDYEIADVAAVAGADETAKTLALDMIEEKEKYQKSRQQHQIKIERRNSGKSNGGETFEIPNECYQRYTNSDHHHSMVDWLHRKNASHYSPISPSYHQALLKIQTDELKHGLQVTTGASTCSSRKMRMISSSTPLRERAVCQFEYILNYKPNRIPSTFTEVKCSCPKPSGNLIGRRMFECEPLRYQVRVLLFDEECLSFTEQTETVALACIPVLQANVNADDRTDVVIPVQAAPEIPT